MFKQRYLINIFGFRRKFFRQLFFSIQYFDIYVTSVRDFYCKSLRLIIQTNFYDTEIWKNFNTTVIILHRQRLNYLKVLVNCVLFYRQVFQFFLATCISPLLWQRDPSPSLFKFRRRGASRTYFCLRSICRSSIEKKVF